MRRRDRATRDADIQAILRIEWRPEGIYFTARELQVRQVMLGNLRYKEAVDTLHISLRTIKFHACNILAKYGVRDRYALQREFR